jgi:hypothetical protein
MGQRYVHRLVLDFWFTYQISSADMWWNGLVACLFGSWTQLALIPDFSFRNYPRPKLGRKERGGAARAENSEQT